MCPVLFLYRLLWLRRQRLRKALPIRIIPQISNTFICAVPPEQWGGDWKLNIAYFCNTHTKKSSIIGIRFFIRGNERLHQ